MFAAAERKKSENGGKYLLDNTRLVCYNTQAAKEYRRSIHSYHPGH